MARVLIRGVGQKVIDRLRMVRHCGRLGGGAPYRHIWATALAPDAILAEVANAAWASVRLGQLTRMQLQAIATALLGFFEELTSSRALLQRSVEMATSLDHPVFDCVYLALAEQTNSPVITADRRFAAKTAGTRWEALVEILMH